MDKEEFKFELGTQLVRIYLIVFLAQNQHGDFGFLLTILTQVAS